MRFHWDKAKASANLLRHGVDFADAATSFDDERALTIPDPDAIHEERFVTLAMDARGRILVTVWTVRDDAIRLISARKASAGERRRYANRLKGDR
jgi:uncharacterized DUF497 family protein